MTTSLPYISLHVITFLNTFAWLLAWLLVNFNNYLNAAHRRAADSMGHGGTCPTLSLMAGHGGTMSRTSNKK